MLPKFKRFAHTQFATPSPKKSNGRHGARAINVLYIYLSVYIDTCTALYRYIHMNIYKKKSLMVCPDYNNLVARHFAQIKS